MSKDDKKTLDDPLKLDMPFNEALERFVGVNTKDIQEIPESNKAKPFVKWAGGKRSLIPDIEQSLPESLGAYYEPFVGGGAVFFHICDRVQEAYLSDSNLDLIFAYKAIQKDPEVLIELLQKHAKRHDKDYYYKIRAQHELIDAVKIAARFIYLNKTCYNGLYRVNKKGEFNVPVGSYKNPSIVQEDNLRLVHAALEIAAIRLLDYTQIRPQKGDFVYFDPPYYSENGNGFTSYTKEDFGKTEQTALRDFARELHRQGVNVMLSNANGEFIRNLYNSKPFTIRIVHAPRRVNSRGDERHNVEEVLITTYG